MLTITAHTKTIDANPDNTIAIFTTEEDLKNSTFTIPDNISNIINDINLDGFRGKKATSLFVPLKKNPMIIIIGLGKKKDITIEGLRNAGAKVTHECRLHRIHMVHIIPPVISGFEQISVEYAIAEGVYLSNYDFDIYKTKKEDAPGLLKKVIIHSDDKKSITKALNDLVIISENVLQCRNMINDTSDRTTPDHIARYAKKLSTIKGVSCKVYSGKDIEKMGMGLFMAVSRGSSNPPKLVVLKYRGNTRSDMWAAIIGKGITFDSGGINLKPSKSIEDMRMDMAGAAGCMYTLKSVAELGIKKNLIAVLPLCENMVSGNSYKPGDIFKAYNGKTVEIGNTDAEGRLILADALAFTEDRLKPALMVDMATLTGACLISFGEIVAGLLTENDKIADELFESGERTGDRLWRLPLYEDYAEDIKSDIADINNISSSRHAGTIIGATFLKNFVKQTPWAHIDIAGTAWISKKRGYRTKYATGYGIRLLCDFIKNVDF